MGQRTNSRLAQLVGLLALALIAVGCSQSSDPTTWEDALAEGKVEENFLVSCVDADEERTADTDALAAYCQCSFTQLQETFADDFGRFEAVNGALRNDPSVIDDPSSVDDADTRADILLSAEVINGCEQEHLPG